MPKKEESSYQSELADALEENGCRCYKQHGNQYSRLGTPDLLCVVPGPFSGTGYFVAIECKLPDGVVAKAQEFELEEIQKAHGIGLIAVKGTHTAQWVLDTIRLIDWLKHPNDSIMEASGSRP